MKNLKTFHLEIQGPNFGMYLGEPDCNVTFNFRVKKTLLNRIKYWLFCKFFPFTIKYWDDIKNER